MTPCMIGNLINHSLIDFSIIADWCLAISFDYLIIPQLTSGYQLYGDLLTSSERLTLHLLTIRSHQLTKTICILIQKKNSLKYQYYFTKCFYSLSCCSFIRSSKYHLPINSGNWKSDLVRLDKHGHMIIIGISKRYYLDSILKYKKKLLKKWLVRYHLDLRSVQMSIKIGYLTTSHNRYLNISRSNVSKKQQRSIKETLRIVYKTKRRIDNPTHLAIRMKIKYNLLTNLIINQIVCRFPGCNHVCFTNSKHYTCSQHRYLETITQNKVIWPSTNQLLDLQDSIQIV